MNQVAKIYRTEEKNWALYKHSWNSLIKFPLWMKKGPHTRPDRLMETCVLDLTNSDLRQSHRMRMV